MPEPFSLVLQGTSGSERTVYSALANAARSEPFDEALFIAPFVTEQGAVMLHEIAREAEVRKVLWLVGLDGTITTPQALQEIASIPTNLEQLGWHQGGDYPYLHAKVFCLEREQPRKAILYIGSANATQGGLADNVEAGTLLSLEGQEAVRVGRELDDWIALLKATPCCVPLTPSVRDDYARHYHPPRGRGRRVSRVVGVERRPRVSVTPHGERTWIEVAVRGGSNQQVEICRPMATFFTRGAQTNEVGFDLVDAATGVRYTGNAYRYRPGNYGHRVEVNADLARTLDLESASARRDVILFARTRSPTLYLVYLYPARSRRTRALIEAGEQEGRVHRTTSGPRSRRYYL